MTVPVTAVFAGPVTPAAAATSSAGQLNGVSCASATFCMAVGTSAGYATTLTESWNGSVWSVVPSPNPSSGANDLASVSCLSAVDCVAVGSSSELAGDPNFPNQNPQSLAETWNGSNWSVVSTTSPLLSGDDTTFESVSCTDSSSIYCVAVGAIEGSGNPPPLDQPLVESWDGTNWSLMSTPPPDTDNGLLTSVSCASSSSCKTVGQTEVCIENYQGRGGIVCPSSQILVESWDGTTWSIETVPNEDGTDNLVSVSCSGSTNCVGMGSSSTGTLAESWDGMNWTLAYGPNPGSGSEAGNVSCISFTNCMGVGEYVDPSPSITEQTFALSWNGTALSVVPSADPSSTFDEFDGVSCVNATFCVAVGSTQSPFPSSPQPLLETWNGTAWSVAPLANTAIIIPSSSGTAVGGTSAVLDATASASAGVSKVQFALTGGSYSQTVIGTAVPTLYGYILVWNTTGVPGGTYTLQSLVTDDDGDTASSPGVMITVDNTPPTTTVIVPSTGARLKGTSAVLDATASASGGVSIVKVVFVLSGRSYSKTVIGTATPTLYGYLFSWNTTGVPDGRYTLQSMATDAAGNTAYSPGITIRIANHHH
jgi:hypothetical protein